MKRFLMLLLATMLITLGTFCLADELWDCRNCGQRDNGSAFCPYCGTERDGSWICSSCGTEGLTTPYCPYCGNKKPERAKWDCAICGNTEIFTPYCPVCGAYGNELISEEQKTENDVTQTNTLPSVKPLSLAVVYYTPVGSYYHKIRNCSGMINAQAHTLADAYAAGKKCCSNCGVVSTSALQDDKMNYLWVDMQDVVHTADDCLEFAVGGYRILPFDEILEGHYLYCCSCGGDEYYDYLSSLYDNSASDFSNDLRCYEQTIKVYYGTNSRYYHANRECQQMLDSKYEHNLFDALHVDILKPCPYCKPIGSDDEAEESLAKSDFQDSTVVSFEEYEKTITVYYADYSKYYHASFTCQNMADDKYKHNLYEAVHMAGLLPCMTCKPVTESEAMNTFLLKDIHLISVDEAEIAKPDNLAKNYPWKTDRETRIKHGLVLFDISNDDADRSLLKMMGFSYGNWEGFDGMNNKTWIYLTNSLKETEYYPVTVSPGCTNITHAMRNGKNMEYADFVCVIDVSDLQDGFYQLGSTNRFQVSGNTYSFGYAFDIAYSITVKDGIVVSVGVN